MLKRVLKVSILVCLLFTIYAITTINFAKINEFQDNMLITQSEIENINQNGHLGKFIKIKKNTSNVVYASSSQEFTKSEISINFLLFPIKTLPVTMIEQSEVCVGGNAVGLVLTTNGATVTDVKEMGQRELAYEIKDFKNGYYYVITLEASDDKAINEFDRLALISGDMIRHLITKLED